MLLTKLHIPSTGKNIIHRYKLLDKLNFKALSSAIAICFVSNSNITTKMADDEKPQSRKIFISSVDLFEGKHLAKVNMQHILLIVLY